MCAHHGGRKFGWGAPPGPGWQAWAEAPFAGPPFMRRGGPWRRMRRGDVRGEVLGALLEGPAHGYEVIRRMEQRSGGLWRPSPGSVYPTLQMLEDAGMVRATDQDGRRTYELTDEGRAEAESRPAPEGPPWAEDDPRRGWVQLHEALGQLHVAARQVSDAGSPEQVERAAAALRQARQALYQILAEE